MSVIGDHAAKKLEKLMAREAKAEEQNIKHALKDVKKAEKAVKKSVKVRVLLVPLPAPSPPLSADTNAGLGRGSQAVEKAEKKKQKVLKTEHSTVKALNKAKHKHADVLEGEAKAEAAAAVRCACLLPSCSPCKLGFWADGPTRIATCRHSARRRSRRTAACSRRAQSSRACR